ncbi:MAG TPA: TIR domain-containing protein [Macellibacteroides fermentans]|uniref:TIR domain-containing protein n=1 Tax=Macellibacteroides fermentans TaxID=879969 RepID=UPI002CF92B60|nr:TIR domain-containing protein [Macellibacteroides fermentans]
MKNKNVFISHFNKDEENIIKLKDLLKDKGYTLRNSSIDSTKPNDAKNEAYVKSLLRDGIKHAGTTIVLIGPETHKRSWVDWEIEQSNKQGNKIVGVFLQGAKDSHIPDSFQKFGDALIGWSGDKIIDAIEGRVNNWEKITGEIRVPYWKEIRGEC